MSRFKLQISALCRVVLVFGVLPTGGLVAGGECVRQVPSIRSVASCCRPLPSCCTVRAAYANSQPRPIVPSQPKIVERDLGTFHWHDGPKQWHLELPQNTEKVELTFYMQGQVSVSLNAAFGGVVQINEKPALGFRRKTSKGYIFHNYLSGEDFLNSAETPTTGQYLDVTALTVPGENEFLYYHYTRTPMGMKLRIHTR